MTYSVLFNNGYTLATHFYNAMTTSHKNGIYKHEGTVEAVYLMDGINVEVISDGIHVPPIILKLIHKFKGYGRMCTITDALAITESPDGNSYDKRIMIETGLQAQRWLGNSRQLCHDGPPYSHGCKDAGIPLEDAVRMASETPALVMDVYDRKGSICKHKDADIIVMDKNLNLTHVIAMGEIVSI